MTASYKYVKRASWIRHPVYDPKLTTIYGRQPNVPMALHTRFTLKLPKGLLGKYHVRLGHIPRPTIVDHFQINIVIRTPEGKSIINPCHSPRAIELLHLARLPSLLVTEKENCFGAQNSWASLRSAGCHHMLPEGNHQSKDTSEKLVHAKQRPKVNQSLHKRGSW